MDILKSGLDNLKSIDKVIELVRDLASKKEHKLVIEAGLKAEEMIEETRKQLQVGSPIFSLMFRCEMNSKQRLKRMNKIFCYCLLSQRKKRQRAKQLLAFKLMRRFSN